MCAVHGPKDILTYVPFSPCLRFAARWLSSAWKRGPPSYCLQAPLRCNQACKKSQGGTRRRGRQQGPANTADLAQGLAPMIMSCGVAYQHPRPPPKITATAYLTWLAVVICSLLGDRLRTCASHEPVVDSTGTHREGWSTKERYDLAPVCC